ncbi:MAG: acyltransferase [Clostridiales bacterium]|nr:acyltransferase [Clostridiales bacterium]
METTVTSKDKNYFIELLRFVFCFILVLHHSPFKCPSGAPAYWGAPVFFKYGAICVEFFYMLTGYFSIKHIEDHRDSVMGMTDTTKYTVKKLIRLLPYTTIAIIGSYLLEFFTKNDLSLVDRLKIFQNLPSELLVMPMTGQIEISFASYRCAHLWFLSCMLIALPVVMYLSVKCNDLFKGYLVWFLPFMLLGYMRFRWEDCIFAWGSYGYFLYGGIIRAFADIMLGGAVYYTVRAIKAKGFIPGRLLRWIFSLCEIMLLAFIIFSCNRIELPAYDQIFVIMMIWIMLVITLSDISYSGVVFSGPLSFIWSFLGKISVPVYCIHWTVFRYMVNGLFAEFGYWLKICINICICIMIYLVVSRITRRLKQSQ